MNFQVVDKWHKTKPGHFVFAFVELGLAYVFVSLAINSGSLWEYLLFIILLVGFFRNFIRIFKTSKHEHAKR